MDKVLFILIDGLGDVSGPDGLTTLQIANTPNFDHLATHGMVGLMDPVEPGVACGSDTAHLSILGYDPRKYYQGRGAFEAIGTGLHMNKGDIAFKCVFATFDQNTGIVLQRRPGRHFAHEAEILSNHLDGLKVEIEGCDYTAHIRYATEHRCGIIISGPHLCDKITGIDPLKDNLPLLTSQPLINSFEAERSSKVVNAFNNKICEILAKHEINKQRTLEGKLPGNIVLFRGPAELPNLRPFKELHGLEGFMIAPTCIIAGIGGAMGLKLIKVPGATGDHRSDFDAKFTHAIALLSSDEYDFGFLHIKAVDEASHSGKPDEKIQLLERIDSALGNILPLAKQKGLLVCLTGDHTTPSFVHNDHTHHPVPFMICKLNDDMEPAEDSISFDEINAGNGRLGRFAGLSVMDLIKKLR